MDQGSLGYIGTLRGGSWPRRRNQDLTGQVRAPALTDLGPKDKSGPSGMNQGLVGRTRVMEDESGPH